MSEIEHGYVRTVTTRLKQPEYTGENRCMPCTIVNVLITIVLAGGAAVVAPPAAPLVVVVGLAAIYFRGYLVPGTPTLTKRYLPERVLRWFGKEPIARPDIDTDVDPEQAFLELGIVEEGADDLVLAEGVADEWHERLVALRDEPLEERTAELLSMDDVAVECDDGGCTVTRGEEKEEIVSRWKSRAALQSDITADAVLSERHPGWEALDLTDRGQLLNGLRTFLPECPDCAGDVAFSQEVVESCCGESEVIALRCADCESHLLEVPANV